MEELPGVRDLLLAEVDPPPLCEAKTAAMNRRWEEAVEANPALFDGPTVVCADVSWRDPETLLLS
ncbi:NUDIX hydrolase, partial [Streptomyces althioticus]